MYQQSSHVRQHERGAISGRARCSIKKHNTVLQLMAMTNQASGSHRLKPTEGDEVGPVPRCRLN